MTGGSCAPTSKLLESFNGQVAAVHLPTHFFSAAFIYKSVLKHASPCRASCVPTASSTTPDAARVSKWLRVPMLWITADGGAEGATHMVERI